MSQSNKFVKGMLIGAIAGGLLSLLDKNTRTATINNCRTCCEKVTAVVKDPNIVINQVKEVTGKVRNSLDQVTEDIAFITEKVSELTDVTPQVAEIVKETKDAFSRERESDCVEE